METKYSIKSESKVLTQIIFIDKSLNIDKKIIEDNIYDYLVFKIPKDQLVSPQEINDMRNRFITETDRSLLRIINIDISTFRELIRKAKRSIESPKNHFIFIVRDDKFKQLIEELFMNAHYVIITGDIDTRESERFIRMNIEL